jgi:4-hydroxybenzoate polyprenyltransferase
MIGRLDMRSALQLGRVSNLPTVWSNVLVGIVLAGGVVEPRSLLVLIVAMSLMYVGGMFLNDAFDAEIDARERPGRPIPSGRVAAGTVFTAGFAMLGAAIFLAATLNWPAGLAAPLLAGTILLYDWHHKANPLSPVLMGLCRMLVYVTAGLAVTGAIDGSLIVAALVLLCYLIGLTYAAKQENLNELRSLWPLGFLVVPFVYLAPSIWSGGLAALLFLGFLGWVLYALSWLRPGGRRAVPRAVVALIAGISLLDATLIASAGASVPAVLAVGCFGLTLLGQRWVSGT